MSKLKDIKQEKIAQDLVKNKFNMTKTYQENYPDSNYHSANSNCIRKVNESVVNRAIEILESTEQLKKESILNSLIDDLKAKKIWGISKKGRVIRQRDNAIVLDTKKFILKLYGLADRSDDSKPMVNINVSNVDISALQSIVSDLKALAKRRVSDDDIQDGEITG